MSNLNRHPVRRTAAGVLASTLAFSGAFAAGTPAFAATGFTLERLSGDDRYETSANIAAEFGTADGAILASGENRHIVDALSASFLAGIREDPVLLTSRGMVSAEVLAQLNALTNKRVTIVGGEMAVSEAVATQLRNAGFTVTRIAGDDRFETSEQIIRAGVAEGDESSTGILVSGLSPVDALAAGALAYKGKHPVFLTSGGTIPQDTLDAMRAAGTQRLIIVGGTTVVPESVQAQLTAAGITVVTRLGGADRSATSRMVADYLIEKAGFSATTFNVASGANNGVDALSGAALSGKNNTVLLVTNTATDPGSVDDFAMERRATLTMPGRIFGGTAVVAPALETQLETAAGGGMGTNPVTLTTTTVAQGGTLTGTIAGDNIQSVTVSGCGFTNATIGADDNAGTAGRQFTLTVSGTQAAGSCNLTFTITPTGGGAAMTQTVAVNVTAATVQSATVRPELQSAQIVGTVVQGTGTTQNPEGTTVRYTFDEAVAVVTAANFKVYTNDAADATATSVVLESGGRSALALFPGFNTATLAGTLTTATVDDAAVRDIDGFMNPEGRAGIGATIAPGGAGTLPAGITTAPDLLSVGNFRAAAQDTQTAVDFTFDEAAFRRAETTSFRLVLTDGNEVTAAPVSELGFGNTSGLTSPGGNGTTTFTLVFTNPDRPGSTAGPDTADIAAAEVGRGFQLLNAVSDASSAGNLNATQAADVSGTTVQPDLVAAQFRPATNSTDADRVLFDFDQALSTTTGGAARFSVYRTDGTTATGTGTPVVNPSDTSQVLVEFANGALVNAVGAVATDGAVTAASGSGVNDPDEEGVAGTSSTSAGQTPSRTNAPDLTGVALSQGTDAFGNATGFRAMYTFDEDLAGAVGGGALSLALSNGFFLYQADGTRLVADACDIGSTEATDNTVTCTGYDMLTAGGTQATSAQIGTTTLGAVDEDVVTGTGTATTVSGLTDNAGNPEGADLTSGGTGTRTA